MNQLKVKDIRNNKLKITNEPIVYSWWFKVECIEMLLGKLKGHYDPMKIKKKRVDNIEYALLYIGQGKKGHDRLVKYHMLDSNDFHSKGVENGRLSSLRTTLCGLLSLPMSQSKEEINRFMDEYCMVEWDTCTLEQMDEIEVNCIKSNYLPLNYQHTKETLTKKHREVLRNAKKEMRK